MKKIPVPAFRFFRILPAAAIFAAGLSVCACDLFTYVRPFDDAYYENNFIADIGFDTAVAGVTPADLDETNPRTGQWDFAYRYDKWDGYDYLTLTNTGKIVGDYGVTAGLSASAPVFTLEMVNLVQHGDFEGGEAGVWTQSKPDPMVNALPSSYGINNASVSLSLGGNTYLEYTLDPIVSVVPQLVDGNSYSIDFRWSSFENMAPDGTKNPVRMNDEKGPTFSFNTKTFHASCSFSAIADVNKIRFVADRSWTGLVDDISVRKVGSQQLRILLKKSETDPPLEDFLYIFSFWIHSDPSVGVNTSPYHLDRMGLQMQSPVWENLLPKTDDDYIYSSIQSDWQKISVRTNENLQIKGAVGAVLELVIDLENALPGRVLIAQPELRAYPDGY